MNDGPQELVLFESVGDIAVITLNRPDKMNAVDAETAQAVGAAIDRLESDPELRVGIITGAGRGFCAGVDLKALAAGKSIDHPTHPEWGFAGLTERFIAKPLIAAVNGVAMGGGAEVVLACDLAVFSVDAKIGLPEVKRGVFAGGGGVIRLPRQVPFKLAMEAVLTGEPINAETAFAWGLANRVVPAGEEVSAAMELARKIAANAPISISTSKRLVHEAAAQGSQWDRDVWAHNAEANKTIVTTNDAKEGPRAFAERRPAKWTGS